MKPKFIKILSLSLVLNIAITGCKDKKNNGANPEIAVANSYLLSIAKDICGSQTEVISLVPPGMCPGHFDISPRQVEKLSQCKTLLLFDFQSQLGDALARISQHGLKIHDIECPEGLCLPQTYLTIARSVADALTQDNPDKRAEYEQGLEMMEKRLDNLDNEIHTKIEQLGLRNTDVISSVHQAEFAGWLGLDVVATFSGNDTETPAGINQCLMQANDRSVKLVIANKQEGIELATALAERLNAKMIVFSNFPAGDDNTADRPLFDSLLLENVSQLSGTGE